MSKIELSDNTTDIIVKMSDGNPGAVNVILNILGEGGNIDPDSALGGLGALLSLDTLGIYGSAIYVLYNDICDSDLGKTLAVLRATQLGLFDKDIVYYACIILCTSMRV